MITNSLPKSKSRVFPPMSLKLMIPLRNAKCSKALWPVSIFTPFTDPITSFL